MFQFLVNNYKFQHFIAKYGFMNYKNSIFYFSMYCMKIIYSLWKITIEIFTRVLRKKYFGKIYHKYILFRILYNF